jgi:hypothetical protein
MSQLQCYHCPRDGEYQVDADEGKLLLFIDRVLQDYQCHFWDILKLPLLFDLH